MKPDRSAPPVLKLMTVVAGLLVLATAGCSGSKKHGAAAGATPTPAATSSAVAVPLGPPSPLSGLPADPNAGVLAVKIDNTAPSRPQAGLNSADIVYVEEVEGGLTRLLAVFSSRMPPAVGPIRSVRTDNVELLAQFGTPSFAFSGGQPAAMSVVRASPLVDVSYNSVSSLYRREPGRYGPYNLFADPAKLLASRKNPQHAAPMGFVFDITKAPTAGVGSTVTVKFPSASLLFTYQPATQDYVLTQDGTVVKGVDGQPEVASNVVVQRITQVATGMQDVRGNFTPANVTVGSGDAFVLRDGHMIPSHWKRASRTAGTRLLTDRTGSDISLRPGTTWVVLAPGGVGVTIA